VNDGTARKRRKFPIRVTLTQDRNPHASPQWQGATLISFHPALRTHRAHLDRHARHLASFAVKRHVNPREVLRRLQVAFPHAEFTLATDATLQRGGRA